MKVHPAAALFPLLGDEELAELAEDIRANGLHEPLWVWDDPERGPVLLDGRNRLAACRLAEVEPATRMYLGDDPVSFVISENLKRRHLTAGQRAFLALELTPLYEAQAKAKEAERKRKEIETQRSKTVADLPQSSATGVDASPKQTRKSKPAAKSRDRAAKPAMRSP